MSAGTIPSGTANSKGLPSNVDAERFVLGSILLDDGFFAQASALEPDEFSLEKHRRIFKRMGDLNDRGERIDRVTVANELMKFGELELCGGLSYLVSLPSLREIRGRAIFARFIRLWTFD